MRHQFVAYQSGADVKLSECTLGSLAVGCRLIEIRPGPNTGWVRSDVASFVFRIGSVRDHARSLPPNLDRYGAMCNKLLASAPASLQVSPAATWGAI